MQGLDNTSTLFGLDSNKLYVSLGRQWCDVMHSFECVFMVIKMEIIRMPQFFFRQIRLWGCWLLTHFDIWLSDISQRDWVVQIDMLSWFLDGLQMSNQHSFAYYVMLYINGYVPKWAKMTQHHLGRVVSFLASILHLKWTNNLIFQAKCLKSGFFGSLLLLFAKALSKKVQLSNLRNAKIMSWLQIESYFLTFKGRSGE